MKQKEELLVLIEEIKVKEEKVWTSTKNLEDEKAETDLEVAKLEQIITTDKDLETGKLTYSNPTARKTALKIALQDDERLQKKIIQLKTERDIIRLNEIELEAKKRKFDVLRRLLTPEEPISVNVLQ